MGRATRRTRPGRVGLNVSIPERVHRIARVACAAADMTWDEAATEAFEMWARAKAPRATAGIGPR
jgi:hypothetical protein